MQQINVAVGRTVNNYFLIIELKKAADVSSMAFFIWHRCFSFNLPFDLFGLHHLIET
jgi:hypothetical protein